MSQLFRLFVYGTLRSGFANHDRFCRAAESITDGVTFGRLYDLPYGFPGLICPPSFILAAGSKDMQRDLNIQAELSIPADDPGQPPSDHTKVFGEVISFADAFSAISRIDRLEGFEPNASSLYDRVLIPVLFDGKWAPVWTYQYQRPIQGVFLPNGIWNSD